MMGTDLPAKVIGEIEIERFLERGWSDMNIAWYEAGRVFSDLGNQAFESLLHHQGLSFSEGASGRRWWFGDVKTAPLTQVAFDWKHQKGRRQIVGQSEKRGTFWHYAISGQVRTSPVRHARISASLIFSNNGLNALDDPRKAHRLRRSFAKTWRNARWRDMMLAFLWWISKGKSELALPVGQDRFFILSMPPASFMSPVCVLHDGEDPPDEDDPDFDDSEWDDHPEYDEGGEE